MSSSSSARHAQFYSEFAAGMIPVALLGSAVYMGLRTWQQHLAHELFLEEAQAHVQQLEAEVTALREQMRTETGVQDAVESVGSKKSRWWLW
ncbi:hypothetical protein C2E23DRAFT_884408 [Lenzites betulinus]|nr:hypothetical protein C2E23DRAFT_884408 [Lenzites betulinus]